MIHSTGFYIKKQGKLPIRENVRLHLNGVERGSGEFHSGTTILRNSPHWLMEPVVAAAPCGCPTTNRPQGFLHPPTPCATYSFLGDTSSLWMEITKAVLLTSPPNFTFLEHTSSRKYFTCIFSIKFHNNRLWWVLRFLLFYNNETEALKG